MGEGGNTFLARQVLDTAISNVARAIKRLAAVGVAKFVVAADHGHLFVQERDESERIEKPGGDQVSLHRRCWAGRGGSNPPATVRITFGVSLQKTLFSSDEVIVQPVLLSDGQHVGHVGMTLDAEFDPLTDCVKLQPGGSCTVGIQLLRDDTESASLEQDALDKKLAVAFDGKVVRKDLVRKVKVGANVPVSCWSSR